METIIPAIVDMTFEEIVHSIQPPLNNSAEPFQQQYSYQVARYALDVWYEYAKNDIREVNETAIQLASSYVTPPQSSDVETEKNPYEYKLDETYDTYSTCLEKLHDSMLIC